MRRQEPYAAFAEFVDPRFWRQPSGGVDDTTRFLFMAGKPYGEEPVFNGPFVD